MPLLRGAEFLADRRPAVLTKACEDGRLTAEQVLETAKEHSSELEQLVATLTEDLD